MSRNRPKSVRLCSWISNPNSNPSLMHRTSFLPNMTAKKSLKSAEQDRLWHNTNYKKLANYRTDKVHFVVSATVYRYSTVHTIHISRSEGAVSAPSPPTEKLTKFVNFWIRPAWRFSARVHAHASLRTFLNPNSLMKNKTDQWLRTASVAPPKEDKYDGKDAA